MKKALLIPMFLLFILLGCQNNQTSNLNQLEQPNNLRIEGTLVSWDEVDNAQSYQVFLNGDDIITNDNYYLIDEEGEFEVYVVAKADNFNDSLASSVLSVEIDFNNSVEFQIEIDEENQLIEWDEIDNVECYNVFINGDLHIVETNQYSFADEERGLLNFRVQGVYPIGETNISDTIYVEHDLEEKDLLFQYSKNSEQNILILNEDIFDVILLDENKTRINIDQVLEVNEYYEIKSDYVLGLDKETVTLFLYANEYKFTVKISINEKVVPYLISSSKVYTDGLEDIIFQFEMFDGDIKQITGDDLTEADYSVQDNLVVINKEYILESFSTHNQISLTYVLETEEVVFGFIIIYKQ